MTFLARRGGRMMNEINFILGTSNNSILSISKTQRRQHLYILGMSGTGKSTLLENLARTDLETGGGFLFIDPHGDTAEKLADSVPPPPPDNTEPQRSVIYFDPLDPECVVTFNALLKVDPLFRGVLASRIVAIFESIWAESWGPRMSYILTNAIRLLLDNHTKGVSLTDIPSLLTDNEFRADLLERCSDDAIKAFWQREYASLTPKDRRLFIDPILNKVGVFANNPILRHIVRSPGSLDIPAIIRNGDVLICNLSKRMGEEPSHLIGSLLVTAFAQAAENVVLEKDRQDFALYIDEFQNFATTSFATILSESRKYRLSMIAANQLLGQLPEPLQYALIGNVATFVVFRVGAFDTPILSKQIGVSEDSLINLPNFQARVKTLNNNSPTEGMLIETIPPNPQFKGRLEQVKNFTRDRYSRPRP